ncbi:DUF5916 domain-containing protein [Candidatus Latescibacterota bacterium]
MTDAPYRSENPGIAASLSFGINTGIKIITKLFVLTSALLLLTSAQQADSRESIVANAGDLPYRVPMINTPVKVDAVLDEPVWEEAVRIDANIEVRPGNNIPSPVKTEALLAYDMENIYVAIIAYDPDPSKIRATIKDRDQLNGDDWVLILFDTFNDQQRTYAFFCNPLGIQSDFIETPNESGEFDTIWDSHGRITDEGYIVEMAIPFRSFPFQNTEGDQIWGFDVVRSYPRNVRHHIGAFPRDRNNNCYMCQAPKLIGFAGVKPGKNLEIDPTFSARLTQEREDETSGPFKEKDRMFDPGVTARWSVTPNMMLSGTLNPDFSQVEADAAQMDINTKFPLYYSEKRPFFVEGSEIFRSQFNLVHTRTLAEPDWGMKLTGKEGTHTIGFFSARDKVTPLVFPGAEGGDNTTLSMQSTGSVVRYKHDVGSSSYIGTTVSDREGDEYHNRVASVDSQLKFTSKDDLQIQLVGSNTAYSQDIADEFDQPDGDFGGAAYRLNYFHNTENYLFYGKYEAVESDFRTDMGFMTQAGYDYNEFGAQYRWRQGPGHWYTMISIMASHDMKRDSAGNILHKVYATRLNYNGPLQTYAELYSEFGKDRYEEEEYGANKVFLWSNITPTGSTNLGFSINGGDQIDFDNSRQGKQLTFTPRIEQKLGRHFTIVVDHRYQQMNVDSKRLYDANVSNVRFVYNFNRWAFLRLNLQNVDYARNLDTYLEEKREDFDANTRKMFSQILFSYKINPQTVFFLGYSDNYCNRDYTDDRGRFDNSLIHTNRTIFTKIGYAFMM